jgi:hypothetical protein
MIRVISPVAGKFWEAAIVEKRGGFAWETSGIPLGYLSAS